MQTFVSEFIGNCEKMIELINSYLLKFSLYHNNYKDASILYFYVYDDNIIVAYTENNAIVSRTMMREPLTTRIPISYFEQYVCKENLK